MIIVEVKEGKFEEALRKFRKKVEAAKVLEEYYEKQYYIKPSLRKRLKRNEK